MMFKQLYLQKKLFVMYYSPMQDYNFTLTGKRTDGTAVEYLVSWQKNKSFTINEIIGTKRQWLEDLSENHELIQSFKGMLGFKQALTYIRLYENKMKQRLEVFNPFLEGKMDDGTYILSFQLKSPILNKERIPLQPESDETDYQQFLSSNRFLYIAVKRVNDIFVPIKDIKFKGLLFHHQGDRPNIYLPSFDGWTSLKKSSYTHPTFLEDITELLLKDPRIRVKLLVT